MSKDEVQLAVGEPASKIVDSEGLDMWLYARSNGVILDVKFDAKGKVKSAKARAGNKQATTSQKKNSRRNVGGIQGGTMETGTPIGE